MSGIGVVSNPKSGKNKRNPELVHRLAYVLGEKGQLAEPGDLDSLEDVARAFRERDIDVLCVNGGDGTLSKVLSAFVRVYSDGARGRDLRHVRLPIIALLQGGTMNTVARGIGLGLKAEPMLGHVVAAYHAGTPFRLVERNLMVVNGEHAGFLFGNGTLSRFLEVYYEGGDASPWKAVKVFTRALLSAVFGTEFARWLFARRPMTVTVDGIAWNPPPGPKGETGFAAIAAGTTSDLGLGFKPFYGVAAHPDHLHALGFAAGPFSVVKALPAIYLARATKRPDILDQVARRFTIEMDEDQSFMLDGDFLRGGRRLSVETGPRVRFVVG